MKWFIHSNGRQEGPYFLEELQKKISEGKVNQDTHVWKPGMPSWKKLREVPELADAFSAAAAQKVPPAPAPVPVAPKPSVQVDELSVFVELPKTAEETPPELPASQAAKLGKEAKKAQRVAKTTETLKTSKQVLPRVALGLATLCLILGGIIAFLSFNKHELDPIAGISAGDFARLKAAAMTPASSGKKVEIAASTDDPAHPRIHIVSNLANGTRFSVTLRGVAGTLIKPMSQPATLTSTPQKSFHAATDRFELPKGEYQVEVVAEGDPSVVASGTYFLGGARDSEYENAMGQAHAQRKQKAESELKSINEAVNLLNSFQEFLASLGAEALPGKQPTQARVDEIEKQWSEFEKSLPQRSIVWQETPTNEFVLSKLVRLARETWQHSKQANKLYSEYFSKGAAPEAELNRMHEAIQAEQAKASDAMVTLKAEIDKTHIQEL